MRTQIGIYDRSRLLAVIEDEPREAWRTAVACVRAKAADDGFQDEAMWGRTANRTFFERGQFRALPMHAGRRR